jgi:hypothetical protein
MGFACAANFAAQRVSTVARQGGECWDEPVGARITRFARAGRPAICEPSPIRMARAYDDRGLSPAAGCRGTRTVDATTSWFLRDE